MYGVRLGKLPPRIDHRTLRLADYVQRDRLPPVPASTNWRAKVAAWPMLLNDQIGDCAIAGPLHQIQAWTANVGVVPYAPSETDALAGYEAAGGYVPGNPATDNGCVLLDVLNYWRQAGFVGGAHKIGAFAALNLKDHGQAMDSVYLLDGLLLGVALPRAYQGARQWQAPIGPAVGAWQPGSWGGHCVPVVDYDADWLYVVTWGGILPMSWHAYDVYCDEAYAVFSPDWFGLDDMAPNGLDWPALAADLAAVTGQAGPPAPKPPQPKPPPSPAPGPLPAGTLSLAATLTAGSYSIYPKAG